MLLHDSFLHASKVFIWCQGKTAELQSLQKLSLPNTCHTARQTDTQHMSSVERLLLFSHYYQLFLFYLKALVTFSPKSSSTSAGEVLGNAQSQHEFPRRSHHCESCTKAGTRGRRGKSKAACPSISFPWLGKYLRERVLSFPGRGQCVQSKLALSQHSVLVSALSPLRNWAKFGQRPIQSPVLEYVSILSLYLLSPESPGGQTGCSHTGTSSG